MRKFLIVTTGLFAWTFGAVAIAGDPPPADAEDKDDAAEDEAADEDASDEAAEDGEEADEDGEEEAEEPAKGGKAQKSNKNRMESESTDE
jgi:hypothetical protein